MFAIFEIKFQNSNNFKNGVQKFQCTDTQLRCITLDTEYSDHEYFSDITLNLYPYRMVCLSIL